MKSGFLFYREEGQVLVLAIIVVGLVLINTLLIISGSLLFSQNTNRMVQVSQATNLAEAGIDKAVVSLNASAGSYNGESETLLGNGSYDVAVTSKDVSTFIIQSTGYIPNKLSPRVKKTVQAEVSKGVGISFVYGLLVGEGGLSLGNGSTINGSVYSNGSIAGGNNVTITGDVYVAEGAQESADQESDCLNLSCTDFIFGKSVSGSDRLDVAQSFQPSVTAVINKVSLKLKKIGSPANLTVKILGDNNRSPDKNNILTSGTLSANLVSGEYSFTDTTFNSTPTLTADTTYWVMVAAQSLDNSNYWGWSMDNLQSYTRGSAKWSDDWVKKNAIWNNINGDLGFKIWSGGVATSISMGNGSVVGGNVRANTINGLTIGKDAYYKILTNSTVRGSSYPDSSSPPPIVMPISSANISSWQSGAAGEGEIIGDITGCPDKIGPGKIIGNVTTLNSCTITVVTPIWITGNLTFGNSTVFKMDPSLGSSSGVIIVDGKTIFQNSNNLLGTGVSGSYLTLLSTYNSQISGESAINTGNSSLTGILYAPFGTISLANNANFKEAVGWKIDMGLGTVLTYDTGLVNTFFSAGPGGSFSIVKGTYQIK